MEYGKRDHNPCHAETRKTQRDDGVVTLYKRRAYVVTPLSLNQQEENTRTQAPRKKYAALSTEKGHFLCVLMSMVKHLEKPVNIIIGVDTKENFNDILELYEITSRLSSFFFSSPCQVLRQSSFEWNLS